MLHLNFHNLGNPLSLDDGLDLHIARLELIDEQCHLKHAPEWMEVENPQAVDYLCQYFGFNKERSITELLRIPICEECIKGIYDPNWALAYCVTCHNSQWFWKPDSKLEFHTDVVWVDACPKCFGEPLYEDE